MPTPRTTIITRISRSHLGPPHRLDGVRISFLGFTNPNPSLSFFNVWDVEASSWDICCCFVDPLGSGKADFWWDPDWDAHECSWYPVGCFPHGYDVNDAYPSYHHHHFSNMSVTPLTPRWVYGVRITFPLITHPNLLILFIFWCSLDGMSVEA